MNSKNYGIEDARKRLGDIVTSVQQGAEVTLTRNGKPAARIVAVQEANVSTISYNSRAIDQSFPGLDMPPLAGAFNPRKASYWVGDGKGYWEGDYYVDRDGERLWLTDDGRWIVTRLGGGSDNHLVSDADAEEWFADNGYTAGDRETHKRRLQD